MTQYTNTYTPIILQYFINIYNFILYIHNLLTENSLAERFLYRSVNEKHYYIIDYILYYGWLGSIIYLSCIIIYIISFHLYEKYLIIQFFCNLIYVFLKKIYDSCNLQKKITYVNSIINSRHITKQTEVLMKNVMERTDMLFEQIKILKEDIERNNINNLCSICLDNDNEKDTVLVPCGHVFCRNCIEQLRDEKCPQCRTEYTQYLKIYL